MRYPFGLVFDSAKHVVGKRLSGQRRFPVMLSVEPRDVPAEWSGNGEQSHETPAPLGVEQCLAAIERVKPLSFPFVVTNPWNIRR